jgi:superfamily I DNA/RNA helicase
MNTDATIRQQALNPTQSFIVQAPAGSGKTELLTQRILVLLAQSVERPEQILAITFTKKAAAEMRERVMRSLQQAATMPEPEREPQRSNWLLSQQVLLRDQQLNWQLLQNPSRLRLQTIDGLCANINHQLPILSALGSGHDVGESLDDVYQQAALNAIERFAENNEPQTNHQQTIEALLQVDNQLQRWVDLLANFLRSREQWLPQLLPHLYDLDALQTMLQTSLRNWGEQRLQALLALTQKFSEFNDWQSLLTFAQSHLTLPAMLLTPGEIDLAALLQAQPRTQKLTGSADERDLWVALSILLTTQEGQWRKPRGITKNLGFPSEKDSKNPQEKILYQQKKQQLQTLLTALAEREDLLVIVQQVRELPPLCYDEAQWQRITQLLGMLPYAVAELKLLFQQQQRVDFSEISLGALRALQHNEDRDIAFRLDQQIRHILVDEFQDTSVSQFELLKSLTSDWSLEDGRTLFLVGDPMQSIYRFRQADVGLFLQAKQQGLGHIHLTYLRLTQNFRSHQQVIEWINLHFKQMFPLHDDAWSGAVSYAPSQAVRSHSEYPTPGVDLHLFADGTTHTTAMVKAIADCYHHYPQASIALLVRQRRHAQAILQGLMRLQIPLQAVDMASLARQPMLQDLLSLTLTLLFPEQALAWASVLRAPWCGLRLADILSLKLQLNSLARLPLIAANELQLNADAHLRCTTLLAHWHDVQQQRQRPISQRVLGLWQALKAQQCYALEQRIDTHEFLQLLDQLENRDQLLSPTHLLVRVKQLYAQATPSQTRAVQVMTIHKAKGLEFDWVFIPHLEKAGRADEPALLTWSAVHQDAHSSTSTPSTTDQEGLLLATMPPAHQQLQASLYACLRSQQQQKAQYESLRLFYVAATRARDGLQLFATLPAAEDANQPSTRSPITGSFLAALATVDSSWQQALIHWQAAEAVVADDVTPQAALCLSRIALVDLPTFAQATLPTPTSAVFAKQRSSILFTAMGSVAHECLAAAQPLAVLLQQANFKQRIALRLQSYGVAANEVAMASQQVQQALTEMHADPIAQWLSQPHAQNAREYPLLTAQGWLRIDHTFVEDGVRWIVDYKFLASPLIENMTPSPLRGTSPTAQGKQVFSSLPCAVGEMASIASQRGHHPQQLAQYQQQLKNYAQAFVSQGLPIKLGLYSIGATSAMRWQVWALASLVL